MMTGQILGGASPLVAIKYQITIMIAIYVSTLLSVTLSILTSYKTAFNEYGLIDNYTEKILEEWFWHKKIWLGYKINLNIHN